jgi:hypothetical protein
MGVHQYLLSHPSNLPATCYIIMHPSDLCLHVPSAVVLFHQWLIPQLGIREHPVLHTLNKPDPLIVSFSLFSLDIYVC